VARDTAQQLMGLDGVRSNRRGASVKMQPALLCSRGEQTSRISAEECGFSWRNLGSVDEALSRVRIYFMRFTWHEEPYALLNGGTVLVRAGRAGRLRNVAGL
jgi:hypothetical protein